MKYLLLLLLTSCGVNGSGNTVHRVEGTAEVEHRIVIDFEVCDDLEPADKAVCIDKMLEVLKGLGDTTKPQGIRGE